MPAKPASSARRRSAASPLALQDAERQDGEKQGGGRKQATREKVLAAAARAIREHGPTRVGVLEIMRQAGLTHGGFYAHFASKEELVAEAIAWMFGQARARKAARAEADPASDSLAAWIADYVSPRHRDQAGQGCPLTTLANDVRHADTAARAAFDAGVAAMAARVARRLPADDMPEEERQPAALAVLAQMVGAVTLARAVADPALSDALLAATRDDLLARVPA